MAEQMTFDWPLGVALGPDDFFVSDANRVAFATVTTPESWPYGKLALVGPEGCGKSHLAQVFQSQTGAVILHAAALPEGPPPSTPLIIEDMHLLPAVSEPAMFHIHNHQQNTGRTLLMTATTPPARWPIALPDLASRMQATNVASIADPDDALLTALILKLFTDRQIATPPTLAPYIAQRIERSFAAVSDIVARLDATALREGKPITQRMATRVLDDLGER